jgi:hypothetical protein
MRWFPSFGSVSATGSQPNGAQASSLSGLATTARFRDSFVDMLAFVLDVKADTAVRAEGARPNLTPESV